MFILYVYIHYLQQNVKHVFAWPNWPRVKILLCANKYFSRKELILLFVLMAFSHVTIQYAFCHQSNCFTYLYMFWYPVHPGRYGSSCYIQGLHDLLLTWANQYISINNLIEHCASLKILRQNKSWGCFVTRWVVRHILSIVGVDMISDFASFCCVSSFVCTLSPSNQKLEVALPYTLENVLLRPIHGGGWKMIFLYFSFSLGWFLGSSR